MEKKTYYISVANGQISQLEKGSDEFEIEASEEEIRKLREIFDLAYSADWKSFWRAHVPFVEYHFDKENDMYDENLYQAYHLIHELGNSETKERVESLGILK